VSQELVIDINLVLCLDMHKYKNKDIEMYKQLIVLLATLLLTFGVLLLTSNNALSFDYDLSMKYSLTFAPPHNEPVVGNRVARYRISATPKFDTKYLTTELQIDAWGVQRWRPTSVIGNGKEAWENSDWGVEEWRVGFTNRVWVWPFETRKIGIFTEHYFPQRKNWGRHGMETNYYWLVGFGGELK